MDKSFEVYLLSIYGRLAPKTMDAARDLHNRTAGAAPNITAARSLGDLSHMVYIPMDHGSTQPGEFLILDQWDSLEGLNQFFANPEVQHAGGEIFSQRDPVVWKAAESFYTYHCPAPSAAKERIVAVVTGKVKSIEEARKVNNTLVEKFHQQARANSNLSHETYLRLAPPNSPEALQFFAVDTWFDAAGMNSHFSNPEFMPLVGQMFDGQPMTGVWTSPPGNWVEW